LLKKLVPEIGTSHLVPETCTCFDARNCDELASNFRASFWYEFLERVSLALGFANMSVFDVRVVHIVGRSIVYKTSYEAEPVLEIGKCGRGLGDFNEPSGITKDGNNVILVADSRNDRIQVN